jgi:hypothetical protein
MCGVDAEALGDAVRPMGSGSGMVGEPVRRVGEASKVDRRRGIGNTLVLNARPTGIARANDRVRAESSHQSPLRNR